MYHRSHTDNCQTMLQRFIIVIVVIAVFLFSSCNEKAPDFSSNETNISGTIVDIGCLIGQPGELIYLDPLLIYYDRYDNTIVTVYDTKTGQFVRRFITEGHGPGEIIPPLRLFASDNQMHAMQPNTGYMNIYELDDIINKETIIPEQVFFESRPIYVRKTEDGYVGFGTFEDGRFNLYDSAGSVVSSFGIYPFRGEEMNRMDRSVLYQGYISTSVDGNYFAVGTLNSDNLEFYHIEDKKAELIKKYETRDVKTVRVEGRNRIADDSVLNYVSAYGGKYCYMLYSGKTYSENNRNSSGGNKIIVFDWEGNYIKSYKVDVSIRSFCVDEENNIIYAATRYAYGETESVSILKFNI